MYMKYKLKKKILFELIYKAKILAPLKITKKLAKTSGVPLSIK